MVASAKLPDASSSRPTFTGSAASVTFATSDVTASPAMKARRIQPDGLSNMRILQKWARTPENANKKKPPDEHTVRQGASVPDPRADTFVRPRGMDAV